MKSPKTARGAKPAAEAASAGKDAVTLLKSDHRGVEALFARFEKATSSSEKAETAREVCQQLIMHSMIEEEIFYPACREKNVEDDMLDEAQVEHDGAKILIADLVAGSPDDEFYDAKVSVLSEYIKHHVGEEEKPSIGIFAKAQQAGVDMSALGQRLQARKQELMAKAEAGSLRSPIPRSLHLGQQSTQRQKYQEMDRRSQSRDRDDQGRFMSDDDDRGYSRGSGRSQGGRRDDEGRFMSDDDRGRSYRNPEDDDDNYRRSSSSRGRGHGGWFGDSEGHSEASQRGWEERGGSRSSRRSDDDYDDRRRSARGRDDDDDDRRESRGRGHGGWFGDPEGHSEASQRGWEERGGSRSSRGPDDDYDDRRRSARGREDDDDDRRGSRGRGHGGWFGDPEGHSEASQRGWEERGGSRSSRRSDVEYHDRHRSARGRDDDDDRHGSRGRSGWFGDSAGHSEASRRGWRNRD